MPKIIRCKTCGKEGHYAYQCFLNRKAIKPIGRVQKATNIAVAEWKATQEPNHEGYYICYLCGKWINYLVAEHTQSKVRHPESRTDKTLLRPVCNPCNERKGSKDVDNFV